MSERHQTPPSAGGAGAEQTAVLGAFIMPQNAPESNAAAFLEDLFGDLPAGAWATLWTVPDHHTHWFANPTDAAQWLEEHGEGRNVYAGIAFAKRRGPANKRIAASPAPEKIAAAGIVALVADVDFGRDGHQDGKLYPPTLTDALAVVKALPLAPTFTVHSGNGLHCWWALREPWAFDSDGERAQAAELCRGWGAAVSMAAARFGFEVDSVADLARVLRVPGTFNLKDPANPRPVKILQGDPDRRYNPGDFAGYIPENTDLVPTASTARRAPVDLGTEDLRLPDDARAEVEARFVALLERDPELRAIADRKRQGPRDRSASGFDLALLDRLKLRWGWTVPAELACAAQWARHRRGDRRAKTSGLRRTVAKALRAVSRGELDGQVGIPCDVLEAGLEVGPVALYLVRAAWQLQRGAEATHEEARAVLGVSRDTVKRSASALRRAGFGEYVRPRDRFAEVPVALLLDPAPSPGAKVTAAHLAACAGKDGRTVIAARRLAARIGRTKPNSERAVRDYLGELVAAGYVTKEVAPFDPDLQRRVFCNRYTLQAPVAHEEPPALKGVHTVPGGAYSSARSSSQCLAARPKARKAPEHHLRRDPDDLPRNPKSRRTTGRPQGYSPTTGTTRRQV